MMAKHPQAHLRTRILIWSFVPTTIILFAVAVTIYIYYQNVTEDLVVGRNQQLTRLSAGEFVTNLNTYVNTLAAFTRPLGIYVDNPVRQLTILRQDSGQLVNFDGGVHSISSALDVYGTVSGNISSLESEIRF